MAAAVVWVTAFSLLLVASGKRYEPNWNSLQSRPLPPWYDEAKYGIFIHWSVFSVPSYVSAWFWYAWEVQKNPAIVKYMEDNFPPGFTYADFAPMFTTEFFNADEWVDLFKDAGAKFIVFVTKHHEGYCNWPSKYCWNWNSADVGPRRDLVGELASSVRKRSDIHLGLYHSLFEFMNPLFIKDQANNFTTNDFVVTKTMPELYELVNKYKPDIVHSDGDWMAPDTYWNSTGFLAWLYNDSPVKDTVLVSDAWGIGCGCKHGGYFTCGDNFNPKTLQKFKFQNQMSIDKSGWTWRRTAQVGDFHTVEELITQLVQTVSCGGNFLMNIGPEKDGTINPIYQERLQQMGQWLRVNGEAIYATKPWLFQNDTVTPDIWYTAKNMSDGNVAVYAISLTWPEGGILSMKDPIPSSSTTVSMLGYQGNFDWTPQPLGGMNIYIPPIPFNKLPSKWAWVFKMENLKNMR
ncbi:alpha-L-fucosidase-like [Gigantopelta aegis]|uniref:alpha-L-fucosidase-like n=1 Tax=Gigantopelta aegis TaxID=1735272 RepID=UPI001B88B1F5|nr:alpha-L-fucosidase-like [Gigantopelta aegis]